MTYYLLCINVAIWGVIGHFIVCLYTCMANLGVIIGYQNHSAKLCVNS